MTGTLRCARARARMRQSGCGVATVHAWGSIDPGLQGSSTHLPVIVCSSRWNSGAVGADKAAVSEVASLD
jgi:hypothetical protein